MYKHHEDSIVKMTEYFRKDPEIKALFLIGSVAVGMEREDSDLDCVAIISEELYDQKKNGGGTMEVVYGHCTYEGGYFDIHYMSQERMEKIAEHNSEPMRNMFDCARVLFCDIPGLPDVIPKIMEYRKDEALKKQFRFYCSMRFFYNYYLKACKPVGYYRVHVAEGMVYNLYRLLLIENEILFPSVRKLEDYVRRAPNKPEGIIELCQKALKTLDDDDLFAIVDAYEKWTSYDYPKDRMLICNNFSDPIEWY